MLEDNDSLTELNPERYEAKFIDENQDKYGTIRKAKLKSNLL